MAIKWIILHLSSSCVSVTQSIYKREDDSMSQDKNSSNHPFLYKKEDCPEIQHLIVKETI